MMFSITLGISASFLSCAVMALRWRSAGAFTKNARTVRIYNCCNMIEIMRWIALWFSS